MLQLWPLWDLEVTGNVLGRGMYVLSAKAIDLLPDAFHMGSLPVKPPTPWASPKFIMQLESPIRDQASDLVLPGPLEDYIAYRAPRERGFGR